MKKTIIFTALVATLLFAFTPSVYAKQETLKLPAWFNQVFQPVQNTIKSLVTRIENLEKKVAELEKAVTDLGKKKIDFNIPNQWGVAFYQEQNGKDSIVMQAPEPTGLYILLPNNQPYCNWNGAKIGTHVTTRAVAHLSTGDIYGAGSCKEIEFQSNENLPESGSSFEVEVYLWWQGTEKHAKQTITVPDRPFPSRDSLLINPSSTLLNTGGSQTQFYTSNQGNLNIGSQTSGGEQLTITNPPNTEGLNLNNQNQTPTNQSQNQNCTAVGLNCPLAVN